MFLICYTSLHLTPTSQLFQASQRAEIDALQKESEIPIEELLKNLPAEILEKPASLDERENGESGDEADDEAEDKVSF